MILSIRTDKPEAEIGLFNNETELAYEKWEAHRLLAETLHKKIQKLLDSKHNSPRDLTAIVVYRGPGSFTGLRIGLSVANALAYGLKIPIAGGSGEDWIQAAVKNLTKSGSNKLVVPEYGAPANITKPRG